MSNENLNQGAFAKANDLKSRIFFTIGILIVYRIGTYVPLAGIDPQALTQVMSNAQKGLIGMFNVSASIVFDWVRHTIQNRQKDEKESDKKLFIKLGIVFWSVPTRNFILVFSLIMQYPAAIVYYTCFPGTYFTLKKAWSLVALLNEN